MSPRASLYDRIRATAAARLPPAVAGTIDLLRPSVARGFGGPFNGQQRRIEAVRDIFGRISFESIIETGTFRATTTRFLRTLSDASIATVEANPRFYHYSRLRLLFKRVTVIRGDSATVLRSLSADSRWRRGPAFFYLDAHWMEALPLPVEVQTIASGWNDFVVLIDDFAVPDDPGYAYDDYGTAGRLDLAILDASPRPDVVVYWPAASSADETGARRGWVVLASRGRVDAALQGARTLRRAGTLDSLTGQM